jgi:hypothetical protein
MGMTIHILAGVHASKPASPRRAVAGFMRETLLVTERPTGKDLATSVLRASLLWARDSVAERTVSTTLSMAYSAIFK